MNLKNTFISPQSTGKTIAAYKLAYKLKSNSAKSPNKAFKTSLVKIIARPLTLSEQTSFESQFWIFHQQCITETEALKYKAFTAIENQLLILKIKKGQLMTKGSNLLTTYKYKRPIWQRIKAYFKNRKINKGYVDWEPKNE